MKNKATKDTASKYSWRDEQRQKNQAGEDDLRNILSDGLVVHESKKDRDKRETAERHRREREREREKKKKKKKKKKRARE